MSVNIQLVEADGAYWINVSMDGKATRRGPFPDADTAEATMARMAAIARAVLNQPVFISDGPAVARGR